VVVVYARRNAPTINTMSRITTRVPMPTYMVRWSTRVVALENLSSSAGAVVAP